MTKSAVEQMMAEAWADLAHEARLALHDWTGYRAEPYVADDELRERVMAWPIQKRAALAAALLADA